MHKFLASRVPVKVTRRAVFALRLVTPFLLAAGLTAGAAGEAAQAATPVVRNHVPAPPKSTWVPFTWLAPSRTAPAVKSFPRFDPRVDSSLPSAGSATVSVPAGDRLHSAVASSSLASAPASGLVRAGTLPVLVGDASQAGSVTVRVADQGTAQAAGLHGMLFTVGSSAAGAATVAVDDSSFKFAYGGDYASRLHLVEMPACSLTTPKVARCQVQVPVRPASPTAPLTARVTISSSSSPVALGVTSGPSGPSGDYTASSLSPSGTWSSQGNTGSFDYSYPLQVPPPVAGGAPGLDLSYDSSTQDGYTPGTNNQASFVGDGWHLSDNYIERSYAACTNDPSYGAPANSGDQCWKGQLLTMSLNGQSTEIVYDGKTFRPANDSATVKIDQLFSCENGTYNNECFRVTENGTQYYFGLNELPGWSSGKTTTQSAWTVPVYCANPSVTCASGNTAAFARSSETEAWRWNLDYAVDLHGNAMAYYYQPEVNNYGADLQTTPVQYTRGGYLRRIDYGMTAGTVYAGTAPDQVVFTAAQRCGLPGSPAGVACTDANFNVTNAASWPDVPVDQDCTLNNAGSCPSHSPTFWTRDRLTSIVTQVQVKGATQQVDRYDFTQSFPQDTDQAPTLWLDSITHTGLDTSAGATGANPSAPVSFDPPEGLANRVGVVPSEPAMVHNRIQTITTEAGAQIHVTYNAPTCTPSNVPSNPAANTANCFPVYWAPYGSASPVLDWFQKYTVHSVLTQDAHLANSTAQGTPNPDGTYPEELTTYQYPDNSAAWHYDDSELVKPANRTYGQFRGYPWVETITGDPNVFHYTNDVKVYDQQIASKTFYLRGMSNNTPTGTGGSTVTVTSTDGQYSVNDVNALAGRPFETDNYTSATGATLQSAMVSIPVIIGPTASQARDGLPALTAQMIQTASTHTKTAVSSGTGWRNTETDSFYNTTLNQPTTGMLVQSDDRGEVADPKNVAACTWTRYLSNPAETLVLPAETITSAQDCTAAGAPQTGKLISDSRTSYDHNAFSYDGAGPAGTAPSLGDATAVAAASATTPDGVTATAFVTTSATTYDSYGRPVTMTRTPNSTAPNGSSLARTTTIAYTPASGALPTQVQTTAQITAGSSPTYQTSSETFDPARGEPTEKLDIAGHLTDLTYDALGRLTSVWLPNKSKSAGDPANYTYSYSISQTSASVVTTSTLLDSGKYSVSETLYDGLMRPRQTQATSEAGGMLVSDTQYNSIGNVVTTGTYAVSGAPAGGLVSNVAQDSLPSTTVTDYDGLGRADLVTSEHDGLATSSTVTAYAGDHTTVIPPAGAVATTSYANARGEVTESDQYTAAPTVTGTSTAGYTAAGGSVSKTTFTYTPAGQQATVTGPDGTVSSFSYDLLGRRTQQVTPNNGTSKFGYDDAGDPVSTTDARGVELDSTYDLLGRRLTTTDKNNGNFELAAWTWDTLQPGQLTSSTRFVPGVTGGYTVASTGYDNLGKSTGTKITLPASETPLPATYTTGYGYTSNDDALQTVSDPRTQGIPGELLTYKYDALGNPASLASSVSTYVGGVSYFNTGLPSQVVLGPSTNPVTQTYTYDAETLRVTDVQTNRTQAPGPLVDDTAYTYDPAGNLTSVNDQQSESGNTVTDTQCYSYDGLDRLTTAWTDTAGVNPAGTGGTGGCKTTAPSSATLAAGPTAYWQSYQYDPAGNRTSETDHAVNGVTGDTTTSYTNGGTPSTSCANGAAQPHELTQDTTSGPSGTPITTSFCYDAMGDTVSRTPTAGTGQTMTWDDEGHLASVTQGGQVTKYLYDADGNLLIRRDPGQTTLFAGDTEIVLNTKVTPAVLAGAVRSYSMGGTPVAVRSSLPGGGLDYLMADPHSTATMSIDATTQAVTRQQYTPYGEIRGGANPAWPDPTRGYLGKPVDATTGYTDLGAREYDPTLGRFISADPILDPGSPQEMGGYTYAADNPITGSDPSGLHACVDECASPADVTLSTASDQYVAQQDAQAERTLISKAEDQDMSGCRSNSCIFRTVRGYNNADYTTWRVAAYKNQQVFAQANQAYWQHELNRCHSWCWVTARNFITAFTMVADFVAVATMLIPGVNVITASLAIAADVAAGAVAAYNAQTAFQQGDDTGGALDLVTASMSAVGFGLGGSKVGLFGAGCGGMSFTATTLVLLANGKTKPISALKPGDKVLATNTKTGKNEVKTVEAVLVHYDKNQYDLRVKSHGHAEVIHTTSTHLFWDPATRTWDQAASLQVGQALDSPAGATADGGTTPAQHDGWMWDLTIQDDHDFYVMATTHGAASGTPASDAGNGTNAAILVHNCPAGSIPDPEGTQSPSGDPEGTQPPPGWNASSWTPDVQGPAPPRWSGAWWKQRGTIVAKGEAGAVFGGVSGFGGQECAKYTQGGARLICDSLVSTVGGSTAGGIASGTRNGIIIGGIGGSQAGLLQGVLVNKFS
jgi:RHS repeat-associated protein